MIMKFILDKIKGNQTIVEDTQLNGIIEGDVIISSAVTFQVNGIVSGNVTLKENSIAYINGIVNGNIVNAKGHLEIFGIVNGAVLDNGGKTIISPNAFILRK